MTYSTGGPGYPPAQQPSPYPQPSAPTTQFAKPEEGPGKWPMYLLAAVAVLGLIGYLVSFGPNVANANLTTVALVLAGLLAAVNLAPKQSNYTGVVAVIAATGFLLAISYIRNGASGWAWITIVIVAGVQALVAVLALLMEAEVITPPAPRPRYDQYPQYGAPGQYYGQPSQLQQPAPQPQQGYAPQPQQNYTPAPGYAPYGGYPGGPAGGFPPPPQAGPPTPPTGFPTYGQPPAPAPAPGPAPEDHEQQPQDSSAQSGPPPA
jgi:hypothetical protein